MLLQSLNFNGALLATILTGSVMNSSVLAVTLSGVAAPPTTELKKYLIVGTSSSVSGDAISIQNTEVGANRRFLSDSNAQANSEGEAGPNTESVFYQNGNRWDNSRSVPIGAAQVFEGTDWRGNMAVTHTSGKISLSKMDVYANLGIICAAATTNTCKQSVSDSHFFAHGVPFGSGANINSGITSESNFSNLNNELSNWSTFIESLPSDASISSNIENQNAKDGDGPYVTSFTDTDGNGISVIDIDVGNNDFEITNSDWILDGAENQFYIFRVKKGSNVNISNSSILLGDGGIAGGSAATAVSELGAIIYHATEGESSSDTVFSLDNVILNGVGLWDSNSSKDTEISVSNAQGCSHFVAAKINMSNIRFSRCSLSLSDVTPGVSIAYYPTEGEMGSLMFEDLFPETGDFDFNDLVVRYNVTVKSNSDTNAVTEILWRQSLVAVGAGYDNGFGVEIPVQLTFSGESLSPGVILKDTSSIATLCLADSFSSVEIGSCSGDLCKIDNSCDGATSTSTCDLTCSEASCTTSGDCSALPGSVAGLPIVKFFNSEKSFSGRSGFFNVNHEKTEKNWEVSTPFQWQTSLSFRGGAVLLTETAYCDLKGKSNCTYSVTPPYNPFISVNGDNSREVHLSGYLGTSQYVESNNDNKQDHAGQNCGMTGSDNGKCFKTATGLPWAIDIGEDSFYVWAQEKQDITAVFTGSENYLSFADWVESGGNNCATGTSCDWWNSSVTATSITGASLGSEYVLRNISGDLAGSNSAGNMMTLSAYTAYDSHGLEVIDQGMGSSMLADWTDITGLDYNQHLSLCGLLSGTSSSYWVQKNTDQTYTPDRPYYVKKNETNANALIHNHVLVYSNGSVEIGSTQNISWQTLSDSLGGCLDYGDTCSFSGVECYVVLESWGGSRQALGKWAE